MLDSVDIFILTVITGLGHDMVVIVVFGKSFIADVLTPRSTKLDSGAGPGSELSHSFNTQLLLSSAPVKTEADFKYCPHDNYSDSTLIQHKSKTLDFKNNKCGNI